MELTSLGTESVNLPARWKRLAFGNVFKKINAKIYQIQTSGYRETGLFPVIDQGQSLIVGYTDRGDKVLACPRGGLIVFGDHTRIVKFANFDFVVGADGTQVLFVPGENVAKFFYYALLNQEVPNTGYSRHFKFLKEMSFSAPDPDEQRVIAAALGDADALIAALDALIAKKRDIKQAAMQQLLTGKTRLPGFSGEWEVKRLGNFAPLQRGFDLPISQIKPGPYPVVYSNGILNHNSSYQVKGPGVVTGRSGTIGNVIYVTDHYWPHNTALWVTSFRGNAPRFVFYLYQSIGFEKFGTGSGVPTLNRNDVHAFETEVPSNPHEQSAIAAILSDMDAELAALEGKRNKVRALKAGMMQELLTGKIRLV